MTLAAAPAVPASSWALDLALDCTGGPEPVASFLEAVAPGEVLSAVRRCLPSGTDPVLNLVRAKLKPGRKLTAEYDVVVPDTALGRRISVTWVAPGSTAPGLAPEVEADARRRGVLAPFRRSWVASDDGRMSVSVAPVDVAFPQLVRLHDRRHLVDILSVVGGTGAVPAEEVTVESVRYRPGQRHVLRVAVGASGAAWFVKVYRDDMGRRAAEAAARAATAFASSRDGASAASCGTGTYVAADRAVVWPELFGRSLAQVITLAGAGAAESVRTAGCALRLLHDATTDEDLPTCPDAAAQAGETLRTAQLVEALLPGVGRRLRLQVGRVIDSLAGLPAEPQVLTHGDYKCDNLLVAGPHLHVLDFDRCGRGDAAADIGKFLADLRWWTDGDGPLAARLHEAFLSGYGVTGSARMARARSYDALLQLRMAARRVPLQGPDWERRVTAAVAVAAATLDGRSES